MKNENQFKVRFVQWKKNVFSIAEKFFSSEDDAKKEAENHSGQVKIYNSKGQPVHNKPEKHKEEKEDKKDKKEDKDSYC